MLQSSVQLSHPDVQEGTPGGDGTKLNKPATVATIGTQRLAVAWITGMEVSASCLKTFQFLQLQNILNANLYFLFLCFFFMYI